jgi:hypothetical protein
MKKQKKRARMRKMTLMKMMRMMKIQSIMIRTCMLKRKVLMKMSTLIEYYIFDVMFN